MAKKSAHWLVGKEGDKTFGKVIKAGTEAEALAVGGILWERENGYYGEVWAERLPNFYLNVGCVSDMDRKAIVNAYDGSLPASLTEEEVEQRLLF